MGAGRTGRHLLGAANGRKLFLKIHVKIQIVISYVFACNKNKALQLQRVSILSILGYNNWVFGCVRFDFVGISPILCWGRSIPNISPFLLR